MFLIRFKHLALVGLLFFLIGCTRHIVAPETAATWKRVGVMSLAAHEFSRQYTGFTIFGNEYENYDITLWKLDDEYEAQMRDALKTLGLFEPVQLYCERKDFCPKRALNGDPKLDEMEEKFKTFADKNAIDAIFVLTSRRTHDFLANTNQYFQGVGFYSRGMGPTTSVSALHIICEVDLIEGRTGKCIATRYLTLTKKVSPELARSKFNTLSAENHKEVRTMLIDLPKDSWVSELRSFFSEKENKKIHE